MHKHTSMHTYKHAHTCAHLRMHPRTHVPTQLSVEENKLQQHLTQAIGSAQSKVVTLEQQVLVLQEKLAASEQQLEDELATSEQVLWPTPETPTMWCQYSMLPDGCELMCDCAASSLRSALQSFNCTLRRGRKHLQNMSVILKPSAQCCRCAGLLCWLPGCSAG